MCGTHADPCMTLLCVHMCIRRSRHVTHALAQERPRTPQRAPAELPRRSQAGVPMIPFLSIPERLFIPERIPERIPELCASIPDAFPVHFCYHSGAL